MDAAPPAPPKLDAAESEGDSHPVEEESPDHVVELERLGIVELAKVVEAPSDV